MKTRNSCLKDVSFDQTVGAKKTKFIDKYFDQDDNLVLNLDDKNAN